MFSTVIEFASNPEIIDPEIVNAQTFDSVGFIPLVLLTVMVICGLIFAYKRKVFASSVGKGLNFKQFD